MFKFFKEKLKGAISKFSKKAEEEVQVGEKQLEEIKPKLKEEVRQEQKAEKEGSSEEKEKPKNEETPIDGTPKEKELKEEKSEQIIEEPKQKGFFGKLKEKITTTTISDDKFENLFSELELTLLENNVAMEVIEKIKYDLSKNLVDKPIKRTKIEEIIKDSLKGSIEELFNVERINLIRGIRNKAEKPFVIAFFGINGSGKTTSIAKIANMLKDNKFSCVLAAADTFRAASIEQLQQHADKLGIKMIKQDYGSDPAAVAFDAINHAKAKKTDVVLIDTAGRLHSNENLMQEMKKIIRVSKPDLKIFIGESITGNDCVEQAKSFNDAVGIDGIILSKADIDEKGGAAISVSYITKKPIIYLGVGQELDDIKEFDSKLVLDNLGLTS